MDTVQEEIQGKKERNSRSKLSTPGQSSPTNVVDFLAVTKDAEEYEICRLFLSSLMLCNAGNVVLSHDQKGAAVASPDALRITLLEEAAEQPMGAFLAPSVLDKENATSMIVS